jgi:hypothetical protein
MTDILICLIVYPGTFSMRGFLRPPPCQFHRSREIPREIPPVTTSGVYLLHLNSSHHRKCMNRVALNLLLEIPSYLPLLQKMLSRYTISALTQHHFEQSLTSISSRKGQAVSSLQFLRGISGQHDCNPTLLHKRPNGDFPWLGCKLHMSWNTVFVVFFPPRQ